MATSMLSLPSAGSTGTNVEGRRNSLPLAVAVAGAAVATLVGGLIAAYLALKSAPGDFIPEDTSFDNYTASTLTITALMAMVTVEWAIHGIRKAFRGQALFAYGITVLLGIAFLNALYYLITQLPFEPGSSPYATVVTAMLVVAFGIAVIGLLAVLLTWFRAIGHQLTTDNLQVARAGALLWHIAAVAWIALYYTVYVTK
jgi:heme/copper-type cytochrome/quinol oxidase subunit 3